MNILGISGFERAVQFKKDHFPGCEEREYRIVQGQDAAAALIIDGEVVAAAAEERFDRRKHSAHFPALAIQYCLQRAGLSIGDIDEIAHAFNYAPYEKLYSSDPLTAQLYQQVYSKHALMELIHRDLGDIAEDRVHQVDHHLAHAASAYYTSGWAECLVVVADGMGEAHGVSVYKGCGGQLEPLAKIAAADSIGILYSLVTLHLGFDFNSDEYKIMGLAPYGDPERFRSFFADEVVCRPNGSIQIPLLKCGRGREDRENYSAARSYLDEHLIPRRQPDGLLTDAHQDVAAALQECLDQVMLHICGHFAEVTQMRRVALAGGVALNCTANGLLRKCGLFDEIYIPPGAADDGAAMGAGLHRAAHFGEIRNRRLPSPFLGPAYTTKECSEALAKFDDRIDVQHYANFEETCRAAAKLLREGRVIAWYRGAMEFGPRALGHRSILADPSHPMMRDRINAMVKMREAFRPFAPAVSLEQVHLWFDVPPSTDLPYMTTIVDVRPEFAEQLPAVTHVNRTARIQTVSRNNDPEFHALLRAVGQETGCEMVLNTSFNVKGQPIVNTPREALYTYLATGIDYLFLEDTLICRRSATTDADRNVLEQALAPV
jgi:carbamoyltransferase